MLIYCHLCQALYCVPDDFTENDAVDHVLDVHRKDAGPALEEGGIFDYVVAATHPDHGDWVVLKPTLLIEPYVVDAS